MSGRSRTQSRTDRIIFFFLNDRVTWKMEESKMKKEELKTMLLTMLMSTAVMIGFVISFAYFDRWVEISSVKNQIWLIVSWFSASVIFSTFLIEDLHRKEDVKEEEP